MYSRVRQLESAAGTKVYWLATLLANAVETHEEEELPFSHRLMPTEAMCWFLRNEVVGRDSEIIRTPRYGNESLPDITAGLPRIYFAQNLT